MTCMPFHCSPHAWHATMMGINSSAIENGSAWESHSIWNQECSYQAAHPQEPDASVYRWTLGKEEGGWRKDTPFHRSTNSTHHARSALKLKANRIGTLLLGGGGGGVNHLKQIYHPPQERSTLSHNLAGMIENTNQQFQFFPCAVFPCLPFHQQGSQSFLSCGSQLSPHRIHNNAQKRWQSHQLVELSL